MRARTSTRALATAKDAPYACAALLRAVLRRDVVKRAFYVCYHKAEAEGGGIAEQSQCRARRARSLARVLWP